MALNWAMVSEDGSRPVPLPGEKIFFAVEKCSVALDFRQQGVKWSANGHAYVTSQRILFLRQPPLPAPADPSVASAHLRTLSIPLAQFVDTRYLIPVFTAPYFEATVVASPGGGLPQRTGGTGGSTGLLKLWFNEGGGMAFRDAVEEVKSRLEEGSTHIEALPLYEAGDGAGATAPHPSQTAPLATLRVPPAVRPDRSNSMPMADDLEAAHVAREAEEREREEERRRAQEADSAGSTAPSAEPDQHEQPPPYLG